MVLQRYAPNATLLVKKLQPIAFFVIFRWDFVEEWIQAPCKTVSVPAMLNYNSIEKIFLPADGFHSLSTGITGFRCTGLFITEPFKLNFQFRLYYGMGTLKKSPGNSTIF